MEGQQNLQVLELLCAIWVGWGYVVERLMRLQLEELPELIK